MNHLKDKLGAEIPIICRVSFGGKGAEGEMCPPLKHLCPPLKMTNVICYIRTYMNIGALNMFAPLHFYYHHFALPPLLNTLTDLHVTALVSN